MIIEYTTIVILTAAMEFAAHAICRLYLGDQRFDQMPIWIREAIGTTILLGVPTTWAVIRWPSILEFLAVLWASAVATGTVLAFAHLARAHQERAIEAQERGLIVEKRRDTRRDRVLGESNGADEPVP